MRNKLYKISTAALAIAITFTLGCEEKSSNKSSSSADEGLSSAAIVVSPEEEARIVARMAEIEEAAEAVETEAEAEDRAAAEAAAKETIEYLKAAREKALKEERTFTDERDSKIYMWVKIGTQTWMSENLNYEAEGSKCHGNDPFSCQKYGRLYNWATAMKACPSGWHLSSDAEWQTLVDFAGGDKAEKLRASGGWMETGEGKPGNGTDEFGFGSLPGGYGNSNGSFGSSNGISGNWWSATEINANYAYSRYMHSNLKDAGRNNWSKSDLFSVRCLRD